MSRGRRGVEGDTVYTILGEFQVVGSVLLELDQLELTSLEESLGRRPWRRPSIAPQDR